MDVTENGWPGLPATEDMLNWVTVPGTNPPVKLQIQKGQPTQLLRAFAADYSAYIEPLEDADTACYTHENSVWNSNHRSGTALDLNWDRHPFHVSYAGFPQDKINAMRDLLAFYTYDGLPLIYWGQDWGLQGIGPFDCMHIQCNGNTFNNPKTADFINKFIRPDGLSTYKRGGTVTTPTAVLTAAVTPGTEKVLQYNHAQQNVAQEKFFDCCPASTQIVLDGQNVHISEDELIGAIGTTTDGTNTVEQALPILNEKTAGAYVAQWLPHDPPTSSEVEQLWRNVTGSIDAGYGCVLNFEVPSNNFPRGTRGSASPQYRGSKVWHYVSCMGYADDGPGGKHFWIADPGFAPFGYWMSLEQAASAIPPHAYAYATAKPVGVLASAVVPAQPVAQAPRHAADPDVPPGQFLSRSVYRTPGEGAIGDAANVTISDDGMIHAMWVQDCAVNYGDPDAIYRIVRSAAGRGAETSPLFIRHARAVLAKVPRDALAGVLNVIAKDEPELLQALLGRPAA